MEKHYKLRVDIDHHDITLTHGLDKYSYVLENPRDSNPHIHYHLITTLTRDTFVKRVKKLSEYSVHETGKHGNGFYSLSLMKPDDDGYLRYDAYLCKQGNPTYHNYSIDEIVEIEDFQEKVKLDIAEKKKGRRTQYQCIVEEYFNEERIMADLTITIEYCVYAVVDYYAKNEILVREFMMQSLIQTLCLHYVPRFRSNFMSHLHNKVDTAFHHDVSCPCIAVLSSPTLLK